MKNILITGAGRGIGRAVAERLAANGRRLYLHGRDRRALDDTARLVSDRGADSVVVTADLKTPEGIDHLMVQIGDIPIDVLVNNAGITYVGPIEDITFEQWQTTIAVNVTAPFLITQKLLPGMISGASIVNILSVAARTVFPQWSGYCMSKFALDGFMQALREELRPRGIRIINVYPAATATDLWKNIPGTWSPENMLPPGEVADAVAYALNRPSSVLVDTVCVGNIAGNQ